MNFNDLEQLADVLLVECETDFEPSFNRQADAICQQDSAIYNNIDLMLTLQCRLDKVRQDQSEQEVLFRLITEKLVELEQSITQLEQCPQEVALPWRTPATLSQHGNVERYKIYRNLLEVASRMDDPDREWPPAVSKLKGIIDDHRCCYEKHFPAIGIFACHTETLMAVETQLCAIGDRLAANEKLFYEICPRAEALQAK